MTTYVYVDGFNLFYGALKNHPSRKWLNLEALCSKLLPRDDVQMIRYFTAMVDSRPDDPQQPQRQQAYLRALATLDRVSVHMGQFKSRACRMPLAKPTPTGPRTVSVMRTEEKGSDVALASMLLTDGFLGRYDAAVIITNDSDLKMPVDLVQSELGAMLGIVNPHPPKKRSYDLKGTFFKQLRPSAVKACQFPETLTDAAGTFTKPAGW